MGSPIDKEGIEIGRPNHLSSLSLEIQGSRACMVPGEIQRLIFFPPQGNCPISNEPGKRRPTPTLERSEDDFRVRCKGLVQSQLARKIEVIVQQSIENGHVSECIGARAAIETATQMCSNSLKAHANSTRSTSCESG